MNRESKLRHFLSLNDFSSEELRTLIGRASELKRKHRAGEAHTPLQGKVLAMIFEKSSTRTRVSFEAGMAQLGGSAMFLSPRDTQLGRGEPIEDTARVLSRMVDCVMIRTFDHEDVETGLPLSDSLKKFPRLFNKLYVYLVRAGEISGNLDGILERIASYLEKQAALRGKIKTALTYPVVVLVIALAVTYFLLTGIVPQFATILDQLGGDLPGITRVLIGISDFLRFQWYLLIGGIVAIAVGIACGRAVDFDVPHEIRCEHGECVFDGSRLAVAVAITTDEAGLAVVGDVVSVFVEVALIRNAV